MSRQNHRGSLAGGLTALLIALAGVSAVSPAQSAQVSSSAAALAHPTKAYWLDISGRPAAMSANGARTSVNPTAYRASTLDRTSMTAALAAAPMEFSAAARSNPLVVVLPDPAGGYQRFAMVDSPVMEAGLAAKHPEIKTYYGKGIDDPTASVRVSITSLGFNASVRSAKGPWYIDPYYQQDQSLYVSYLGKDLTNVNPRVAEGMMSESVLSLARGKYHAKERVQMNGFGFTAGSQVAITVRNIATDAQARQTVYATAGRDGAISASLVAEPYKNLGSYTITATDGTNTSVAYYNVVDDRASTDASVGGTLRTYRLALLSDPGYATYHGAANVTSAKVALINRVTQVYEDETSIRLVLIAGNDALNLNTAAQFSQTNGPCGGTACFPTASVSCTGAVLTRNRQVIGLLVGASAFDIGHIGVGAGGGGIASLGVVGGSNKAQGCTGLPTPVGDLFAVDYVAHEMGHQFSGNHTFNGVTGSCSGGNRSAANSVEPGSGTSVMAYAGICGTDNTQPHSDPYWSFRSFDEITTYTSAAETNVTEVQMGALIGYSATGGTTFQLSYNGATTGTIGTGGDFPYTTAGIAAALLASSNVVVTASAVTDTAFTLTFTGSTVDQPLIQLVNCTNGCSGYVGEIAKGGLSARGGSTQTATGNSAPTVTTPASYTIPLRTPFALTGTGSDTAGDTVTYLWEQTDRGGATGTSLISNTKTNGPLFRQFGTYAAVSATDTVQYNSPNENRVTTNPTRVFPDLPQIIANNTNAETGSCPTASAAPTIAEIDCYSEFLPTASYVGFNANASPLSLNFRVTARDGRGGVNSANTQLLLAPGTGPFLVTSPNSAVTLSTVLPQTVTWSVAGTDVAPIATSAVKISLSTDGGATFPIVLAASTPNTGSASVVLPSSSPTTRGRIKVEAVDNVFFDMSNADFTIKAAADVNNDGLTTCADLAIVRASLGKRVGQPGFDPRADINGDGVVDIRDLSIVTQALVTGSRCS